MILLHNHPSGDPSPSAEDRAVTTRLVKAGKIMDIPVLDHVIIGRERYFSFKDKGLLTEIAR
jgi:DNA repair protein RadC